MSDPNEALFDASTRHLIYVTRYGASVARRMLRLLERADQDVRRRLSDLVNGYTRRRLEALLVQIGQRMDALRIELGAALNAELGDLAEYEADFLWRMHNSVLEPTIQVSLLRVSLDDVRAAALSRPFQGVHLRWANAPQHADELVRRRFAAMRDEIRRGYVEGESVQRIVRRVLGAGALRYLDGVTARENRAAETIVRTAVNHTANAAREQFYLANPDVVRKVRWNSVLDGRTSAVCRARDGNIYEVGKGPRPPAHPNCRSTTVAVIPGYPRHSRPTYNDWLKRQSVAFQDEVLGPSRARLFRDGGLTLDRFVDRKGREYTLEDLARREAEAFAAAGLTL